MNRGFTLLEMIVYLGLFGMIMTGAVVSAYTIFESSLHNQTKAMVLEEGSYLVGKLDWALSSAASVTVTANTLSITQFDGAVLTFTVNGGEMTLSGATLPLSNSNVSVDATPAVALFEHTLATGEGINPERVRAAFRLTTHTSDGFVYIQDFSTAKYLRK